MNTGSISVRPPQGASGQVATVSVYTADNQNSMFLQAANPATYAYPETAAPQIASVYPSALPAGYHAVGTAARVDITVADANLVDGQVTVGFGTSDISVRRVWVMSPTRVVADVVVANNASVGATSVSVISGFQAVTQASAMLIQPANPNLPAPALPVYNALSYATVLHGADYASVFGANLETGANTAQVSLNGISVPVLYSAAGQINFQIPPSLPSGPVSLQISNGTASAFPIMVQIDSPPAVINVPNLPGSITSSAGTNLGVMAAGDIVNLQIMNVDPSIVNSSGRVQVTLAGVPMTVLNVAQMNDSVFQIQFAVTQSFAGSMVPLVISVDGSPSLAMQVTAK